MTKAERDALRTAFADYMRTEGRSYYRDYDGHAKSLGRMARLLGVRVVVEEGLDREWADFSKFESKRGEL